MIQQAALELSEIVRGHPYGPLARSCASVSSGCFTFRSERSTRAQQEELQTHESTWAPALLSTRIKFGLARTSTAHSLIFQPPFAREGERFGGAWAVSCLRLRGLGCAFTTHASPVTTELVHDAGAPISPLACVVNSSPFSGHQLIVKASCARWASSKCVEPAWANPKLAAHQSDWKTGLLRCD